MKATDQSYQSILHQSAVNNPPSSKFLRTPQHPLVPSSGTGQFHLSNSTMHLSTVTIKTYVGITKYYKSNKFKVPVNDTTMVALSANKCCSNQLGLLGISMVRVKFSVVIRVRFQTEHCYSVSTYCHFFWVSKAASFITALAQCL